MKTSARFLLAAHDIQRVIDGAVVPNWKVNLRVILEEWDGTTMQFDIDCPYGDGGVQY